MRTWLFVVVLPAAPFVALGCHAFGAYRPLALLKSPRHESRSELLDFSGEVEGGRELSKMKAAFPPPTDLQTPPASASSGDSSPSGPMTDENSAPVRVSRWGDPSRRLGEDIETLKRAFRLELEKERYERYLSFLRHLKPTLTAGEVGMDDDFPRYVTLVKIGSIEISVPNRPCVGRYRWRAPDPLIELQMLSNP